MDSRRKQKLNLNGNVTESYELNERSPIPVAGFSPVDLYLKELRVNKKTIIFCSRGINFFIFRRHTTILRYFFMTHTEETKLVLFGN